MDESSGDDMILKTEPKPFLIQLKPSLDNSSQNDDDDIYFSTNCLLKLKSDNKSLPNKKNYSILKILTLKRIYLYQIVHKNLTLKKVVKYYQRSRHHLPLKITILRKKNML